MANSSWSKNSKPRGGASALGKDFIPHMKAPRTEFPLFNGKRVTPSLAGLDKLLHYYGVELQEPTLKQIWEFHQLLRANNDDQDLTRLNAFENSINVGIPSIIIPLNSKKYLQETNASEKSSNNSWTDNFSFS